MNLVGGSSMPAAENTSSIRTPSHGGSRFDHLVTQWMSRIWWVFGSALNSAQFHLATGFGPTLRVKDQSPRLICGVGPADSTGKSAVSDWPGGSLLAMSGACCRPVNPRVTMCLVLLVRRC